MDEIFKGTTIDEQLRMIKLSDWMLDHGLTMEEFEDCIHYIFNPSVKVKFNNAKTQK